MVNARAEIDGESSRVHLWVIAQIKIIEDGAYADIEISRVSIHNEMTVTIQRLHVEAAYEISIISAQIRVDTDETVRDLNAAVAAEIAQLTLDLAARLKLVLHNLTIQFNIDV